MAVGVELIVSLGTPAEGGAQERVANAARLYRDTQLIAVEVRRVTRVWMRPYVHQVSDSMALHQGEERPDIVV
jgi:hypothetical protein